MVGSWQAAAALFQGGCTAPLARRPSVATIKPVGLLLLLLAAIPRLDAQTGENILLVVNRNDAVSRQVADYYRPRRSIPVQNVCYLATTSDEAIKWDIYEQQIERPVGTA